MSEFDDPRDALTLLIIGGVIVLALLFSGGKAPPQAPQYSQAPAYNSYIYDDHSTNVCVGWCPSGSR